MLYVLFFFFFNDTTSTEIYTLSLHDALPISDFVILSSDLEFLDPIIETGASEVRDGHFRVVFFGRQVAELTKPEMRDRSEEHTSELQSRPHLVCRLLLEKKKKKVNKNKKTQR